MLKLCVSEAEVKLKMHDVIVQGLDNCGNIQQKLGVKVQKHGVELDKCGIELDNCMKKQDYWKLKPSKS